MERVSGKAGDTIAAFDLCYFKSDGLYYPAKADAEATMPGVVLATAALVAGEIGVFIESGLVTNAGWSLPVDAMIYASAITAGAITPTIPNTPGNLIQILGKTKAATKLNFKPQLIFFEYV